MTEKIKQIAMRIKDLREIESLSIESASQMFGIAPDEYAKYESGETDIPVSFLYEVAQKFNVELTALLTGESPKLKMYSVVRAGKGLSVERRKEYGYQDLAYNFIGKKIETFLVTVPPGEANPHGYRHPGQEFTYVLEGSLKISLDGHEVILHAGDAMFFNSGNTHAMTALNGQPAKFLAVIA